MAVSLSLESLADQIAGMKKSEIIDYLMHFEGRLRLDFTESFLQSQTDEKLRHILFAALNARAAHI